MKSNHKMRTNFVEILSRIRLNLTNVEQFIGTACSLADDNPTISKDIHEAARQIRSSALLIDHLRSLFAHQQTIDWRQQLIAGGVRQQGTGSSSIRAGHSDNLGYFSYANKQTLIRAAKCLVANVAKILYLTDEIVLKCRNDELNHHLQQQQQQQLHHHHQQQQQLQSPGLSYGQKLQATDSEAATTLRDQQSRTFGPTTATSSDNSATRCRHQDAATEINPEKPNLSDRLDNVANYSQLLRSFGEFSVDLIDLGNCIMLARHVGSGGIEKACPCVGRADPNLSSLDNVKRPVVGEEAERSAQSGSNHHHHHHHHHHQQQQQQQHHSEPTNVDYYRQASSTGHALGQSSAFDSTGAPLLASQLDNPALYTSNIRPSSSSYSMPAAGNWRAGQGAFAHLPPTNEFAAPRRDSLYQTADIYHRQQDFTSSSGRPLSPNNFRTNQEVSDEPGLDFGLTSHTMSQTDDFCQVSCQIQDIQILFQVNRLIIDRSILLLLSASKCCLRLGSERSRGFEARKLIGVQIRVSISIIMALVKCSVFGGQQQTQTQTTTSTTTTTMASGQHQLTCGRTMSFTSGSPIATALQKHGTGPERRRRQDNDKHPEASARYEPVSPLSSLAKWPEGRSGSLVSGGEYGVESPALCLAAGAELHQLMRAALDDVDLGRVHHDQQQRPATIHSYAGEPLAHLATINNEDEWHWQQQQHQRGPQRRRQSQCLTLNESRMLRALDENQPEHQRRLSAASEPPASQRDGNNEDNNNNNNSSQSLDIMDHFLVTLGGTLSAHNSIQCLQTLVEPFVNVRNQDQLAASLDHVLKLTSNKFHLGRSWAQRCQTAHHQTRDAPQMHINQQANNHSICTLEAGQDRENLAPADFGSQHAVDGCPPGRPATSAACWRLAGINGRKTFSVLQLPPVALMNKRQLVGALNFVFLGELKQNLVERLHEFTDCAYTKHEHRETILSLLSCIKFILNKFVKLVYRLRRRIASPSEPNQLGNLRQFARQLVDFCAQLNYELQTAAVELADELDRLNGELELMKQMKHHCLVGDTVKARLVFNQFCEQSEQLVETCKILNQIAPTNKLKITTKSLASWFQSNYGQLVAFAGCLSESPTSRTAKDCTWTYIQVWSSFYDDFCQLSRQLAYLAHSKCDPNRADRVANLRQQIQSARVNSIIRFPIDEQERRRQLIMATSDQFHANSDGRQTQENELVAIELAADRRGWPRSPLQSIGSHQSLGHNQQFAFDMIGQPSNDSPRSLDHYHGFGSNYRRWHEESAAAPGQCNSTSGVQVDEAWPQSRLNSPLVRSPQFVSAATVITGTNLGINGDLDQYNNRQHQVNSCDSSLSSLAFTERHYHTGMTISSSQIGISQQQQQQQQQQQPWSQNDEDTFTITTPTGSHQNSRMGVGTTTPASYLPFGGSITPLAPTSIRVDPTAPPIEPPSVPARRSLATTAISGTRDPLPQEQPRLSEMRANTILEGNSVDKEGARQKLNPSIVGGVNPRRSSRHSSVRTPLGAQNPLHETDEEILVNESGRGACLERTNGADQNSLASSTLDGTQTTDKWSDSEADAIVRGARETAQMALSMYQFTRGEGDLNTTQDLFTQAELFAEEANELYKEVRCFSYKVPAGDLKKELLFQLSTIPALVQQLQFTVKNPTVGKAATFAKVDSVIRETKCLMEAVNRVVEATLSCRQHYNMASASLRKRTRTLSPTYRGDKFEFEPFGSPGGGRGLGGAFGGPGGSRHASNASGGLGSEPDI